MSIHLMKVLESSHPLEFTILNLTISFFNSNFEFQSSNLGIREILVCKSVSMLIERLNSNSLILKLYSYWYSERLWDTRKRNLTLIRGKLKITSSLDLKQPISEIINLLRDKVFQGCQVSRLEHFSHIVTQKFRVKMDSNISNLRLVMVRVNSENFLFSIFSLNSTF